MKLTATPIKTGVIEFLIVFESFFLTKALLVYAKSGDYFTPPLRTILLIGGFFLLLIYTYSLTVGAWHKWEQYILVPAPISLGILAAIMPINITYATIAALVAYILVTYDMHVAKTVKDQLIKFDPRVVFRLSSKGIILVFSLVGATLVFLQVSQAKTYFDVGDKIGDFVQKQMENIISPKLDGSKHAKDIVEKFMGNEINQDPEMLSKLSGLKMEDNSLPGIIPPIDLDLKDTMEKEVNTILEPYKQFIPSLIAIVALALFQFISMVVMLVFRITIGGVFWFFEKVGFFKKVYLDVKKEELTF